jgi:uncharacterized protein (DUF885 family)
VQAAEGARFDLSAFHERVMTEGIAPCPIHRSLLLRGNAGALIRMIAP